MLKFIPFLLLVSLLFAQQNSQEKDISLIKGVKITYLPKEYKQENREIRPADIILSYAGFPVTEEKILLGVDQFLLKLEQLWEKEGKKKEFWNKQEEWIQKRTRGVAIKPDHFSEKNAPLYEVSFKRKKKIKKDYLKAGFFLLLFKEKNEKVEKASALHQQGNQARRKGLFDKAFLLYQESIKLNQMVHNLPGIADSLNNIGLIQFAQGNTKKALDFFEESYQMRKQFGTPTEIATSLNNLAFLYQKQGKLKKALAAYKESYQLKKQVGEPRNIALSLENIGDIYQQQGKIEEALEHFEESYKIRKQFGTPREIATSLNNLASLYQKQGKLAFALKGYKESYELFKQAKKPAHIAISLNNMGDIFQTQGRLKKALECYQKSYKLIQQIGNPREIALSLNNLGSLHEAQGKLELALNHYKRSCNLFKQVGDPTLIATTLNNISGVYQEQGQLEKALNYCKESYQLGKKIGNPSIIITALNNRGSLYQAQGKLELALNCYKESLKQINQLGFFTDRVITLNNIAGIYNEQEKIELSLEYFEESYELAKQSGNPIDIARALHNIGSLSLEQGKVEKTLKCFEKAYQLRKQIGNPIDIATSLHSFGNFYRLHEQFDKALKCYLESIELFEKAGNSIDITTPLYNIAGLYETQGKIKKASEYYLTSIEKVTKIANQSGSGRENYFKKHLHHYFKTFEFLANHKSEEKAFEVLQYFKGFGFSTNLSELNLPLEDAVDKELVKKRNLLMAHTSAAYKQLNSFIANKNVSEAIIQQKKQELKDLDKQLKETIEEIRSGNPAYATIQYPKPVLIADIQKNLKKNQLFLEYFCVPKENKTKGKAEKLLGQTYCFLIGNNFFETVCLGDSQTLENHVRYFRSLLWESQKKEDPQEYYEEGVLLYNLLLKPALKIAKKKQHHPIEHLLIAPDGLLNILAFEALCLPQKEEKESYEKLEYLLDHYQISYTMSATVYKHILDQYSPSKRDAATTQSFFGLGDPFFNSSKENKNNTRADLTPLKETREELLEIAKLFDKKKILLGIEAIEPAIFLEDLLPYQILHFATHGLIDTKKPFYSSLALTSLSLEQQKQYETLLTKKGFEFVSCSDGFLRVRDIFTLSKKISAELVVLSACETALGKIEKGDGVVGLSRAFQFAGSPSIIVSLWAVADKSTSLLMQHFYRELLREKPSTLKEKRLAALHQAKKKLRYSKEYNAPYYWAPFILRGLP